MRSADPSRTPHTGPSNEEQRPTPWTNVRKEAVMRKVLLLAIAVVPLTVLPGGTAALAAGATTGFGFNAPDIAGAPTGEVAMTGGGAFNPTAGIGARGRFLQLRLPGEPGTARLMPCWRGCPVGRRGAPVGYAVQVHWGGDRTPQDREHQRPDRRAAGRLLSSRRWERRVLQGEHDRLGRRHRSRHNGRPGCLGAGSGVHGRAREPQLLSSARSQGISSST